MNIKGIKENVKYRKIIFTLLMLLIIWFIIPRTKTIEDSFVVYNYSDKIESTRNLDFRIRIIKYNKLFPVENCSVLFEIGDRIYRYNSKDFKGRKNSWVFLKTGNFNFGVLLPNSDFSEFVVIFDERKHHYDVSNELEFFVYPQRSEEESRMLLEELIKHNHYNFDSKY